MARGGCSPMIASAVALLPDPDSPTTPSTRPAGSANDTERTASTTPLSVGIRTTRSVTSSTARGDRPSFRSAGESLIEDSSINTNSLVRASAADSDRVVVDVVHGLAVHVAGQPIRDEVEVRRSEQRRPRCRLGHHLFVQIEIPGRPFRTREGRDTL